MKREPAVIAAGIAQLISLIIPALVLFEVIHWSDKQIVGFMAVITFAAGFVATVFTRQNVTPLETANQQINVALKSNPETTSVQDVIEKVEAKNAAK